MSNDLLLYGTKSSLMIFVVAPLSLFEYLQIEHKAPRDKSSDDWYTIRTKIKRF
jgi:hypothetical protein